MAVHKNLGRVRISLCEFVFDIVNNKNQYPALANYCRFRQFLGPGTNIDVSTNRRDWGHLLKVRENFRITNIAGVNDEIRSFQCLDGLRTEQAVGI